MTEFVNFVTQHWLLSCTTLCVVVMIISLELNSSKRMLPNLDPQAAVLLLNHGEALLIDLRSTLLFNEAHIAGARNIPAENLAELLPKNKLSKTITLILVTTSGTLSKNELKLFQENGFPKIALLAGGINAWREANFPLI